MLWTVLLVFGAVDAACSFDALPSAPGTDLALGRGSSADLALAQAPADLLVAAKKRDGGGCRGVANECEGEVRGGDGGCAPMMLAYHYGGEAWRVLMDDTYLYWNEPATNRVLYVRKSGGELQTVLNPWFAQHMAMDSQHLYLAGWQPRQPPLSQSKIGILPKAGGEIKHLFQEDGIVDHILVDDGAIYYVAHSPPPGRSLIKKTSKDGSKSQVLAELQAMRVSWIGMDADALYWTERETGKVQKLAKNGGIPVILAENQRPGWRGEGLVDGRQMYWLTSEAMDDKQPETILMMVDVGGGGLHVMERAWLWGPLAADQGYVYGFGRTEQGINPDQDLHAIKRRSKCDGMVTTIFSSKGVFSAFRSATVDDTTLFYLHGIPGRGHAVSKLLK